MLFENIFSRRQEKLKNKNPKSEIEMLRDELDWIARILTGTKLEDFVNYLIRLQKDICRLEGMCSALNKETSFSVKIVLEKRILDEVQIVLGRTEKMRERIEI